MSAGDVGLVDAILREVAWRSTVYAHEILPRLEAIPGTEETVRYLETQVARCNGDVLLHAREFLDALLDVRNMLKEALDA